MVTVAAYDVGDQRLVIPSLVEPGNSLADMAAPRQVPSGQESSGIDEFRLGVAGGSVFDRRAPGARAKLEALLAKPIGQGTALHETPEPVVAILTEAYEEAAWASSARITSSAYAAAPVLAGSSRCRGSTGRRLRQPFRTTGPSPVRFLRIGTVFGFGTRVIALSPWTVYAAFGLGLVGWMIS